MSLTTVNVDVRDDRIGIRKAELDRLMIRGDKLTIRGYEFSSGSIKQSTTGDVSPFVLFPPAVPPPPSPPCGGPFTLYSSFWTILVLHLLVIHAYT